MQKIVPFLWFNSQAEEAVDFYVSVFKNSKKGKVTRYGEGAPVAAGTVMTVTFDLDGQEFVALNGGPVFAFSSAISFYVKCSDQKEIDELWNRLSEGGEELQCGWLKDKYGVTWQIVPPVLIDLLQDKDAKKARRVLDAMLQMKKIEIAVLQRAHDQ